MEHTFPSFPENKFTKLRRPLGLCVPAINLLTQRAEKRKKTQKFFLFVKVCFGEIHRERERETLEDWREDKLKGSSWVNLFVDAIVQKNT